jgi:NAD(P) transhydrogenase subunit beta
MMYANLGALLYLVAAVLFLLSLGYSYKDQARGNMFGMIGMRSRSSSRSAHPPAGSAPGCWWWSASRRRRHRGGHGAACADDGDARAGRIPLAGRHGGGAVAAGASTPIFDIGTVGPIHGASLIEMSLGAPAPFGR